MMSINQKIHRNDVIGAAIFAFGSGALLMLFAAFLFLHSIGWQIVLVTE